MAGQPVASLVLRFAAVSDLGRYRKDNQDSGFAGPNLLVVADGVGGAAYGDVASHTAVHILRRLDEPAPADPLEALAGAFHRVHDRLGELVEQDPELDGTSTTITAGLFDGHRIAMAHLGDSRAYLLRDRTLRRLTKDHTFVQTLVDEGRISEEQSRSHPHRNLILRAVDGVHDAEPDLFMVDLQEGDRLLFCSDGCTGVLDDGQITGVLSEGSPDLAAVSLVRAALDADTTDNVTVVVADVVDESTPVDEETSAAASTGPMLVGAASGQPRKLTAGSGRERSRFRRSSEPSEEGEGTAAAPGRPVDPEELRYAPRAPRRRPWLRRLAGLVALVVLLGIAGKVAYEWSQRQYYVSDDGENVAIYQGVDFDLPGVTMHQVAEKTDVTLAALPEFSQQRVREGIDADDLADARRIVQENLTDLAVKCPTPSPTPSPAPQKTAPTRPGKTAAKSPAASPRPSALPSPSPPPSAGPSSGPGPTLAPPDCLEAGSAAEASP